MVPVKELGYAIRGLLREPRFAVFCVLMLGVGIAANTAIFSIVNGVLLRPLPYEEPEQLVRIHSLGIKRQGRHFAEATKVNIGDLKFLIKIDYYLYYFAEALDHTQQLPYITNALEGS